MDNLMKLNNAIVDGLLEQKAEVISEGVLIDSYFEEFKQVKRVNLEEELSEDFDPLKEWIINKLYAFAAKHGI